MKKNLLLIISTALLLFVSSGCLSTSDTKPSVTVAAVQFNLREEMFTRERLFYSEVERLVEQAVEEKDADVVVFPEYSSVFFSFRESARLFEQASTFEEGFAAVRNRGGVASALDGVEKGMDDFWGDLAEDYDIFIVAGTAFLPVQTDRGIRELRNRAFVYGPDGSRIYTQDKVYLTPFETDILHLSPGSLESAGSFEVHDREIVLSVCRDTFMEEWEPGFAGADLWIDLKANGDTYDQEQVENFREALPERISRSAVPYGITVCLTGSFLDLFWEGESSVIMKDGDGYTVLQQSETWTDEDILYFTLVN